MWFQGRGVRGEGFVLFLVLLLLPGSMLSQFAAPAVVTSPTALTIYPGTTATVQVQVSGNSSVPTAISFSNLPGGVTASPAPLLLNPGSTRTVTLTAALNADAAYFQPSSSTFPNTHTTTVLVTALAGGSSTTSNLALTVSLSNPSYAPTSEQITLPVVRINTGGTPIDSKDTNVPGTITVTSADGSTTYLPSASATDNTATFHLHGNTTIDMPKKPYTVKLNSSLDLLHAMGLSCGYVGSSGKSVCDKSKSFLLLANYDDKSLLRDWSASALANQIPIGGAYLDSPANSPTPSGTTKLLPWAPHSLFVELYVNGAYEGNYQLIEQIKVDGNRLNIPELSDTAAGDLSGGYLLEIDQHQDEDFVFHTPQGLPIGLVDPDYTPEVTEQTAYISNYVSTAENALFATNFTDPILGWRAYFDEASAVNFYIVNDLMGNVDGGNFYSSDYLYKTAANPLLYMGPVWDFDISSGNTNYASIIDPALPYMQTSALWYERWFQDPGFRADVAKQWNTLKANGVFASWLASIQQQASLLSQSQANNFQRWPILGETVWPNPAAQGSYAGEVGYLTNWLSARMGYLDAQFNAKARTTIAITGGSSTASAGAPITFTASVSSANGAPTGTVTFLCAYTILGTATLDGAGRAVFRGVAPAQGTGFSPSAVTSSPVSYPILAVYSGDTEYGLSQSALTTLTVSPAPVATTTVMALSDVSLPQGTALSLPTIVTSQSGSVTPTGTITYRLGGDASALVSGAALGSGGAATGTISATDTAALAPGSYPLTASYGGDAAHLPSTETLTLTVAASTGGDGGSTPPPTLSLASGTYAPGTQVTLSEAVSGATIFYTEDGTTPTSASQVYSGPITLPSHAVTLMAIAIGPGPQTSLVASATYASTGQISAAGGFPDGTDYSFNGSATLAGTALQVTDGGESEAGSVWYKTPVDIRSFTTDFTFQMIDPDADGFTFALQNAGTGAIGGGGGLLGYAGGATALTSSVALKFDIYNNAGEGNNSIGLYGGGEEPTVPSIDLTPSGLDLRSGHSFHAHVTYDGTTIQLQLSDLATGKSVAISGRANLPQLLNGSTAYAGFTGGTGALTVTTRILDWTYVSN